MRWRLGFAVAALVLVSGAAHAQAPAPDRYVIDIAPDMTTAVVTAELDVAGGRVFMNPFGADDQPRGWATFVQAIEASGADGRSLALVAQPDASWTLPAQEGERVRLRYNVDLSFARRPWSAGNEQAGQFTGEALFLVARPLIVMSEPDGAAEIEFGGDPAWRISAPWAPLGADGRRFAAANRTELVQNSFVIGAHPETRVTQGVFTVIVALPGVSGDAGRHVTPVIRAALSDYLDMFPRTPRRNFLLTFFYAPQEDGEAYSGSAAFTVSGRIPESDILIWGNFIAHEAMHHWNGQSIRSSERARTRWFSEGFTEYFANAAMARGGVITTERWLRKAESHVAQYMLFRSSPAWSGVTLAVAGENSGRFRPGVYNGGWAAALCLDGEIRERTGDRRSLRDLMSLMYERYGLPRQPFTAAELYQAASEVAGADMSSYFARYVDGDETLPVHECLARFGLAATLKSYAGEAYLRRNESANRAQQRRLRALLD